MIDGTRELHLISGSATVATHTPSSHSLWHSPAPQAACDIIILHFFGKKKRHSPVSLRWSRATSDFECRFLSHTTFSSCSPFFPARVFVSTSGSAFSAYMNVICTFACQTPSPFHVPLSLSSHPLNVGGPLFFAFVSLPQKTDTPPFMPWTEQRRARRGVSWLVFGFRRTHTVGQGGWMTRGHDGGGAAVDEGFDGWIDEVEACAVCRFSCMILGGVEVQLR